ncbi:MAG: DUF5103 domain-containing protein [Bacteroidales bacterium]|nr:DUF5103 domain-containing protein [Bacteroidales bacterium]
MRAAIVILTLLCALSARALTDTMTGLFNDRVRSVQTRYQGDIFAVPMVTLGSGERLTVVFDHLSDDREYLRYRVVRCDADWRPSTLAESEFLDGFNESPIDNYDFSRATTVHYVNYWFEFPDDNIRPTLSGNYLIQVYPENDPDDVWFQTRVMVSEQTAVISAQASSRTDIDYNDAHQQLSIEVDTERARVDDPFNDLTVVIQQNGRYDNEVALRHPLRATARTAVYEHMKPLIFEAGNEYRRMEISNVNYPGMHVEQIEYAAPYYHFSLETDGSRAGRSYLFDRTQHGRFYVREYNSDRSDIEADYAVVHFSLDYPEIDGAQIFLDGDMVQRRFDPGSIMTYNRATGRYEKVLLLKQGAYNYQYLTVLPRSDKATTSVIEGNKYQTVNEYLIKVYTRRPGDRTDRLIGVTFISTEQ